MNHPDYYGGEDNPYEVIKVAEAWGLDKDAYLFNVLKYIARPGKGRHLQDLMQAVFYLNRKVARMEAEAAEAEITEAENLAYSNSPGVRGYTITGQIGGGAGACAGGGAIHDM